MLNKILKRAFFIFMIAPFFILQAQTTGSVYLNGNFYDIKLTLHNQHLNTLSPTQTHNLNSFDSLSTVKDSVPRTIKKFRMHKSPTLAVLLSAVIPGAGQLYNGSYWKIPIIDGLIAYFGYEYIQNNNKFKDYRNQYNATITPENPFGNQSLKTLREFYRSQRDDFVWYFIIVYVVNLVDAYVDAHLFDFDVKEEKLIRYGNPVRTYRMNLNINF